MKQQLFVKLESELSRIIFYKMMRLWKTTLPVKASSQTSCRRSNSLYGRFCCIKFRCVTGGSTEWPCL